MTDIHSHILFNIDDGSRNIEESIGLLRKLKECGFDNIIFTPHYIDGTEYDAPNEVKREILEKLKKATKENGIDINMSLGNEIFICNNIFELIEEDKIMSLNNGEYLLVELPFHNQINNLEDILYEIKIKGYIPIIAHPERYSYFQEDHSLVDNLREEGVLFQSNYASILGYFGKDAEKLVKYMLKNKYIDYLGTDVHRLDKAFVLDNFNKIVKKINKITGRDYFDTIMNNCDKLVEK